MRTAAFTVIRLTQPGRLTRTEGTAPAASGPRAPRPAGGESSRPGACPCLRLRPCAGPFGRRPSGHASTPVRIPVVRERHLVPPHGTAATLSNGLIT